MSNVQIPNLTPAISLNGTEQLEAVQGGVSVRVTASQIAGLQAGPTGPEGPQGVVGPTGPIGPTGPAGEITLPGGADTQVQFNDGGAFGGSAGLTFNKTAQTLTITSGTQTASTPALDMTQTWNNAATTFTGYKLNVTDTASNASSLLMDLQVGGVSRLRTLKGGYLLVGNPAGGFSNTGIMAMGAAFGTSAGNTGFVAGEQLGFHASSTKVGEYVFGLRLKNNSAFTYEWSSTGASSGASDLIIGRRAPASLRLGAADAAAPVAQTLGVQSVVAGTTNTAGANFTIAGSQGTGTGAGGSIVFQVAPAGSTGTAQNALVNALTLSGDGTIYTFGPATINDYKITRPINAYGAATTITLDAGGNVHFNAGLSQFACSALGNDSLTGFRVRSVGGFSFSPSSIASNSAPDLILTRKASASLRLGAADAAAPVAQTLGVQSVVAGTTNTAGANFTIAGSQGTGTGAGGNVNVQVATAGSSGTAQNALATSFTFYQDKTFGSSGFTVATLPPAGIAGRRSFVTDATAPVFLTTLTGGGSVVTPVFDNGSAWVSA